MSFATGFQAHSLLLISSSSYDVLLYFGEKNDLCNGLGKCLQSTSIADETTYIKDLTIFTFVLQVFAILGMNSSVSALDTNGTCATQCFTTLTKVRLIFISSLDILFTLRLAAKG